jgi:low temperature requirement protein LtrA
MKKTISVISYIIAVFFIFFGGLLIGGSCSESTMGGGYVFDYTHVFSIIGFLLIAISYFRFKRQIFKYKILSAIILILYGLGLYFYGQHVMYSSHEYYGNTAMGMGWPPNPISLVIYKLTIFLTFVFGLILIVIAAFNKRTEATYNT